jgi:ADP-ribosyl-[dinitrogen reductase] hydrolase
VRQESAAARGSKAGPAFAAAAATATLATPATTVADDDGPVMSTYAAQLSAATSAARAAGDVLRAEFLRPGGPRGDHGHCDADGQAERLIRDRLSAAFPAYGWLAEELGDPTPGTDPAGHVWVVDPHDGTSAMLGGHRGTAVSIGLVRHDVPVLGVVYAFAPYPAAAAADVQGGDLIAWAEGCGPVTRNGAAVDRLPLAAALAAAHTVLVSQAADKVSEANARLTAPARFRAMPSIAYRLALVAAGDAEAAVSLAGARDWDFAAGHALVRGVGGALVDEAGKPIAYAAGGRASSSRCFGGSVAVATELASRPWEDVSKPPTLPPGCFDLTRPSRDAIFAGESGVLARAVGCLVGQVAGDSLGGLVEFRSAASIAKAYPAGVRDLADGGHWDILAGQPTDDSEMALMLARAIVKAGKFDPASVLEGYAYWYGSSPFDMGTTTSQALSAAANAARAKRDAVAAAALAASQTSQANGALMRVAPLGVFGHAADPGQVMAWARADAKLTHPHPVCQDASAVFAAAVAYAVRTGAAAGDVYRFARELADAENLHADLRATLAVAEAGPPGDFQHQMGWVRIALQNAFHQLLRTAGPSAASPTAATPHAALVDTVGRGGDTDTNAAICGALVGAVHGVPAWPASFVDRVLTCRPINLVPGGRHPRPRDFWPVDLPMLAERLLVLGARAAG